MSIWSSLGLPWLLLLGLTLSEESSVVGLGLDEGDDECMGHESCALSALQHKTSILQTVDIQDSEGLAASAEAPDSEFRDDNVDDDEDSDHELASLNEQDEEDEEDDEDADLDEHDDHDAEGASLIESGPNENLIPASPITGCHNGTSVCPKRMKCVTKYDKTYSQCMSCREDDFLETCQKLNDFMRYAAIHTCKRSCLDSKCFNNKWCMKPFKCIVDVAEKWGQCVSCRSKVQWRASCHGWKPSLLKAAQKRCRRKKCKYGVINGGRRRRRRS